MELMIGPLTALPQLSLQKAGLERAKELQDEKVHVLSLRRASPIRTAYKQVVYNEEDVKELDPL